MPKAQDCQFALFGRIFFSDYLIKKLNAMGFPAPLLITSLDNEYYRDIRLLTPFGLWSAEVESLAEQGLVHLHKLENVNSAEAFELFERYNCNIGFSTSCRNIIKKPVIDYFDGRIFNIHDSYLPDERGGALNTWRILNGINSVGDTIHYLDEGVDSGDVIVQKRRELDKPYPKPVDYLLAEVKNCEELIDQFLDLVLKYEQVPSQKQDNNKSLYFPRLFTELNGVINWDWDAVMLERFIRAFSCPYPGASTYYRNKRIHILDAHLDTENEQAFHPFCNGKVVTILDNQNVRVIGGGRALILTEISVDGNVLKPAEFLSVKYTLNSDLSDLEAAKKHVPTTKEMNKDEVVQQEIKQLS